MRKRIMSFIVILALFCSITVEGVFAYQSSSNRQSENPITSDFIKTQFQDAMKLYCDIFTTQGVDRNDSIPTTEYFGAYYRVKQANSLLELKAFCRQYFSDSVVDRLTDEETSNLKWKEQNGKLYVSPAYGLGGPGVTSVDMVVTKDSSHSYYVKCHCYDDAGLEGDVTLWLNNQYGNWVWNEIIFGWGKITVNSISMVDNTASELYTVERIDRSVDKAQGDAAAKVITYYDLVQMKPEACAAVQKVNATLKNHMEKRLAGGQTLVDEMENDFAKTARIQQNGKLPWNYYFGINPNDKVYLDDNIVSYLEEGYYSYDDIDSSAGHGIQYAYLLDCVNIDLDSGKDITLAEYLGMTDAEVKQMLRELLSSTTYPKSIYEAYLKNTVPSNYKFNVVDGAILICFDSGEILYEDRGAPALYLMDDPAPRIVREPSDCVGQIGSEVSLSVHCYGTNLSYRWEISRDNGKTWQTVGTTRKWKHILQEGDVQLLCRCIISNSAGSVTSGTAKIIVNMTEDQRREEYTRQHLEFINGKTYSERLNNTWAYEIAAGENTAKANVAEALYDVLNTEAELLSGKKLSVFNNPYDAILTDMILQQTDTQVSDYQLKYKIKELEYIQNLEKLCEKADPNWALKESEYKTLLEKLVESPKSVNDSFYNLCEKTFGKLMSDGTLEKFLNGYQKFGVGLKALNTYGEVVNWVSDCLKFNAVVDAYLATSDNFKQTLLDAQNQMYQMAVQHSDVKSLAISYNDFKQAVADFQKYQTAENITPLLFQKYTEEGAFKITKVFSGTVLKNAALFLQKKGIPSASWVYAAIEAYKIGWSISEDITQNGDIMDCKKLSRAYYYLEDALLSVVQTNATILKQAKTYEGAQKFDAAYSALRDVEYGAIVNYIKLLDEQQASVVQSIKNRGLLPSWETAHYNFAEIENMVVEKLKWEMANCHDEALDQESTNYQTMSSVAVCCPTDVYVYNSSDELVCSIKNGIITRNSRGIVANLIDDQKYLVIPDLNNYRIEIRVTGDGKMDYSVGTYQYSTGKEIASVDYLNVPILKGESYLSETNKETNLTKENKQLQPNYRNAEELSKFTDVRKDAYYYNAVQWAVNHDPQITNGTSANKFSPDANCTRGQMVTFLWRAAGCPKPTTSKNPFKDVKKGEFYYDAVLWAAENGITTGTSKTTFAPNATVNRAQAVTFLWRMEGQPKVKTKNPFKDVKSGQYYTDAVLWAAKEGITTGTTKTTFKPNDPCVRAQIVTFLYRDLG